MAAREGNVSGGRRADPLRRDSLARARHLLAWARWRARQLPRRLARGGCLGDARPLSRPTPAARVRLRNRPGAAGSHSAARRDTGRLRAGGWPIVDPGGGVADSLAPPSPRGARRRLGRVPARCHDAGRPAAPAQSPHCAADRDAPRSADAARQHSGACAGRPSAPDRRRLGDLWACSPDRAFRRR